MPLGGVASAPVSESDIEDVRIRLTASFPVEVTWGSPEAPASAGRGALPFGLTPVEGQPRVIVGDPARNVGKMNNVFPGRYRVMPGALQVGFHVTAVMWGGRDVNGQVLELAPGAAPFQVILSSAFGKVRGTAEKGEGATVVLNSREPGEILQLPAGGVPCGRRVRVRRCDAGRLLPRRVRPGGEWRIARGRSAGRDHAPCFERTRGSGLDGVSGSEGEPMAVVRNRWPGHASIRRVARCRENHQHRISLISGIGYWRSVGKLPVIQR